MQFKHKIKLLLNDPSFKRSTSFSKSYKARLDSSVSQQPKQLLHKNVFPSQLEIQRFRHLEQARVNTFQDMQLSKNVDRSIQKMQLALKKFAQKDHEQPLIYSRLQNRRESFFGKFKMDYVEEQMNQNLEDLNFLVGKHQNLNKQIKEERSLIEKSLKMTEIKKALKIQNELLKSQNQKLKLEQKKLDYYLSSTVKK